MLAATHFFLIQLRFSLLNVLGHDVSGPFCLLLVLDSDDLAIVLEVLLDDLAAHLLVFRPLNVLQHWQVFQLDCSLLVRDLLRLVDILRDNLCASLLVNGKFKLPELLLLLNLLFHLGDVGLANVSIDVLQLLLHLRFTLLFLEFLA